MMPLVFERDDGVEVHVNPWHIAAWWRSSEGNAVIMIHGNQYLLKTSFETVNREIREADQPE
jgi:hypothetical protein